MSVPSRTPGRAVADELSLAELVLTFYRRRWILLTALFLGGLGGLGFLAAARPVYTARTLVIIEAASASQGGPTVASTSQTLDSASVDSQVQILTSRSLARSVVAALGSEAAGLTGSRDWLDRLLAPSRAAAGTAEMAAAPADPTSTFLARLEVGREGKSHVIAIGYSSTDPAHAAAIANKVAEVYMADQRARKQAALRRTSGRSEAQLDGLKRDLDQAVARFEAFRAGHAVSREAAIGADTTQIAELDRALTLAVADRSGKQAEVAKLRALVAAGMDTGVAGGLGTTPLLANLSALKAELLRKEAELAASYGDRHPKMVDVRKERAELDARIAQERQVLLRQAEADVAQAGAKERALATSLAALKGRAVEQEDQANALQGLAQEVEFKRRLYEAQLTHQAAEGEFRDVQDPDARVISEAVPPSVPSYPKPRLTLSLALTAGLLAGLALTYLAEAREPGYRTPRDAEADLRLPVLAAIPRVDGRRGAPAPGAFGVARPRSRYAEAMRGVLATLMLRPHAATGDAGPPPARVVLVTSSLPDEGKSTFVLSLARAADREGLRVLVIDADLRKPSLHGLLGLAPGPGLVEVLRRELPLREAIAVDPRGGARLVRGSERTDQPTRLLGPDGLGALLAAVRPSLDLILIDSSPLAAVADARLIAKLADQVLLLVRHVTTPGTVCAQALQALMDSEASVAGIVLSRVDLGALALAGDGEGRLAQASLRAYYAD